MEITCPYTHADIQIKPNIAFVTLKETCIFQKKVRTKAGGLERGKEGGKEKRRKNSLMFIPDGNFAITTKFKSCLMYNIKRHALS